MQRRGSALSLCKEAPMQDHCSAWHRLSGQPFNEGAGHGPEHTSLAMCMQAAFAPDDLKSTCPLRERACLPEMLGCSSSESLSDPEMLDTCS